MPPKQVQINPTRSSRRSSLGTRTSRPETQEDGAAEIPRTQTLAMRAKPQPPAMADEVDYLESRLRAMVAERDRLRSQTRVAIREGDELIARVRDNTSKSYELRSLGDLAATDELMAHSARSMESIKETREHKFRIQAIAGDLEALQFELLALLDDNEELRAQVLTTTKNENELKSQAPVDSQRSQVTDSSGSQDDGLCKCPKEAREAAINGLAAERREAMELLPMPEDEGRRLRQSGLQYENAIKQYENSGEEARWDDEDD